MPINLANSNLLPFLSPRVGPTDKGSEYGEKIGAMFIYFEIKNKRTLKRFNYTSQHDIERMEKETHLQDVDTKE